jgi:hypothetical protein
MTLSRHRTFVSQGGTMKRTTGVTVGLVLAGLLGVSDIIGFAGAPSDGPPVAVLIADTVLGIITVVGVVLGWRGRRGGIIAVIVTRLLSALSAVPAFFAGVPAPLVAMAAVGIAVTLIAVALLTPALRTRAPAVA